MFTCLTWVETVPFLYAPELLPRQIVVQLRRIDTLEASQFCELLATMAIEDSPIVAKNAKVIIFHRLAGSTGRTLEVRMYCSLGNSCCNLKRFIMLQFAEAFIKSRYKFISEGLLDQSLGICLAKLYVCFSRLYKSLPTNGISVMKIQTQPYAIVHCCKGLNHQN